MAVNLDKPHLWKEDTRASVDHYNTWFMKFAPKAFRDTRVEVTKKVEKAVLDSKDMSDLSPELLQAWPGVLPTLRMSCCPPLAVDRLVGLAYASKSLVKSMELGRLPLRMSKDTQTLQLASIVKVISALIDPDIFAWVPEQREPTAAERHRASTIVADRLTGAVATAIVRNALKENLLNEIAAYLKKKGYVKKRHPIGALLDTMAPGTFTFHHPVMTGVQSGKLAIPVDVLIQPRVLRSNRLPILVEVKSAGDFTATLKGRQEAKTVSQLRTTFTSDVCYVVFLCGYFDCGYLGYEAADGIDWVWEHRIDDFAQLGI